MQAETASRRTMCVSGKDFIFIRNVVFRKYMSFFRMSGVFLRRRVGRYLLDLDDAVAVHSNAEMTVFLLGAVP